MFSAHSSRGAFSTLFSPILLSISSAPSPTLKLFLLVPGDVPVDAVSRFALRPVIRANLPELTKLGELGLIFVSLVDESRRGGWPGRGMSRLAAFSPGSSTFAVWGLTSSVCPTGRGKRSTRPPRVTPTTVPPFPLPPTPSCMPLLNLLEEAEEHTLEGLLLAFAVPAISGWMILAGCDGLLGSITPSCEDRFRGGTGLPDPSRRAGK